MIPTGLSKELIARALVSRIDRYLPEVSQFFLPEIERNLSRVYEHRPFLKAYINLANLLFPLSGKGTYLSIASNPFLQREALKMYLENIAIAGAQEGLSPQQINLLIQKLL